MKPMPSSCDLSKLSDRKLWELLRVPSQNTASSDRLLAVRRELQARGQLCASRRFHLPH
jgi:hypothetical protein